MKKIPLHQLSAYFPYKVKAEFREINNSKCRKMVIGTIGAIYDNSTICCYDTINATPDKFKLLLHPLSWLTDEVLSEINCDILDQITISEIRDKQLGYWNAPYNVVQILLEKHVDLFGLIEQGLAKSL